MPRPHAAQRPDGRQRHGVRRRVRLGQRVEQPEAVGADRRHIGVALGADLRYPPLLDPLVIPLVPIRWHKHAQPIWRDNSNVVQRRAQRLGHKLQAVEAADGGQHVRAVGALAPARLEQPVLTRGVQYASQQAAHRVVVQQPAAELAQHAAVETRVGQVEGEQVFPVDPSAHGVRRLPVTQTLAELQQRHQRQPPRRVGRLAALGVEVGEVGIREQRAEPVT